MEGRVNMRVGLSIFVAAGTSIMLGGCLKPTQDPEPRSSPTFDKALTLLQTQAHAPDPVVRANCIEALQSSRDPRALEVIEQGLHDDQWVVRFAAAMAAAERKADFVRPVLNTLVDHDPNGSVRVACVYALRRLGDTRHMNDLAVALGSPDASVRANTALVLGFMKDPGAIELLQMHHDEQDIRVKNEITAALARLGDEPSQQVIIAWAVNKYAEDEWMAMSVCADLPQNVAVSPLLLGLADAPPKLPPDADAAAVRDLTTRRQLVAARSLAKMRINNQRAAQIAIDNAQNPNPGLRALALLTLGEMLSSRQAPTLDVSLNDPDEGVRRAAAAAIINIYSRVVRNPA